MYKIGSSQYFSIIIPGTVTEEPEEKEDATELPLTMLPRQTEKEETVFTTYGPQEETTEEDKFTIETTSKILTAYPTSAVVFTEMKTRKQDFRESVQVVTKYPESMSVPTPTYTYPELDQTSKPTPFEAQYLDEFKTTNPVFLQPESTTTIPESVEIPETLEP